MPAAVWDADGGVACRSEPCGWSWVHDSAAEAAVAGGHFDDGVWCLLATAVAVCVT